MSANPTKVLLVRPVTEKELVINLIPPIGLGYLATALRRKGIEAGILDCVNRNYGYDDFRNYLKKTCPQIVGFSVFSHDVPAVNHLSRIVKEVNSSIIVIIGGPHPSGLGKDVLGQMPDVDFAFQGEGEISLPLLVKLVRDCVVEKEDLGSVPGLIWRDSSKVFLNPPLYTESLDMFDFPAWDLIPPAEYPNAPQGIFFKKLPTAPIVTSRGCPFECKFCAAHTINGRKIRRRSSGSVIKEMKTLKNTYGVHEFHILDDNFTSSRQYVVEVCKKIVENNLNISWCCPNGVRVDTLDDDMLYWMKKSGCYYISVGIESGSQRVLDSMKKRLVLEKIEKQIKLINRNRLPVNGFFLIGYPGETERDIRKTIRFSRKLGLERVAFYNFLPLPGTENWQELSLKGKTESINWRKMFEAFVPYTTEGLSEKRLKYYQKMAYLLFYLRPIILFKLLIKIKKRDQFKFLLKRIYIYMLKKN